LHGSDVESECSVFITPETQAWQSALVDEQRTVTGYSLCIYCSGYRSRRRAREKTFYLTRILSSDSGEPVGTFGSRSTQESSRFHEEIMVQTVRRLDNDFQ